MYIFRIITLSQRLLPFVEKAVNHYQKQLRAVRGQLQLITLRRKKHFKSTEVQRRYDTDLLDQWRQAHPEAQHWLLDLSGSSLSTTQLVSHIQPGQPIHIYIGGDIGLDPSHPFFQQVHLRLKVSPLTLSHQVCVVLMAEQAWRLAAIHAGHPYHR